MLARGERKHRAAGAAPEGQGHGGWPQQTPGSIRTPLCGTTLRLVRSGSHAARFAAGDEWNFYAVRAPPIGAHGAKVAQFWLNSAWEKWLFTIWRGAKGLYACGRATQAYSLGFAAAIPDGLALRERNDAALCLRSPNASMQPEVSAHRRRAS